MTKKKEGGEEIERLKKEMAEGKMILGTKRVLKGLKEERLEKVYLASNCSEKIRKEVEYYGGLAKIPLVTLGINSEEVGIVGKKHFFISVLGVERR